MVAQAPGVDAARGAGLVALDGRVELVLCDQIMPNLLGQYVLERIHQRDPRVMKILLTGQAGIDAVTYAINHAGLHKYIEKPWTKYDLLLTVENLMIRAPSCSSPQKPIREDAPPLSSETVITLPLPLKIRFVTRKSCARHWKALDSR